MRATFDRVGDTGGLSGKRATGPCANVSWPVMVERALLTVFAIAVGIALASFIPEIPESASRRNPFRCAPIASGALVR